MQTIIGGEKGSQQVEYIHLVTTLKFPRFSCKRLKIFCFSDSNSASNKKN